MSNAIIKRGLSLPAALMFGASTIAQTSETASFAYKSLKVENPHDH